MKESSENVSVGFDIAGNMTGSVGYRMPILLQETGKDQSIISLLFLHPVKVIAKALECKWAQARM